MTRKQLPKAIRSTGADVRGAAAESEMKARPLDEQAAWEPLPPAANDPLPAVMPNLPWLAEKRLREAFRIVGRHKLYAGLGGLFPMPAVNVVSVTAVILRMVKALSDLYGVPFERDKTRSIVIGLMAGAAPTGLGAATAATLTVIVPGAGAIGLAVSSVTAVALTRAIGVVFIERFEKELSLP